MRHVRRSSISRNSRRKSWTQLWQREMAPPRTLKPNNCRSGFQRTLRSFIIRVGGESSIRANAAASRGDEIEHHSVGVALEFLPSLFDCFAQLSSAPKKNQVEPLQF